MRKQPLVTDQYYHIYNRGVDKRDIFVNRKDLYRFILSVKEFNRGYPTGSLRDKLNIPNKKRDDKPLVSIVCYCFNPNHFHFVLKQETDGGISEFCKRLLGGYTKYFNQVHGRTGALFQGRFKSKLLKDDQYFLKILPYVNVNYLTHVIPPHKRHLVYASDSEYEKMIFQIVSKEEAFNLLKTYGGRDRFREECKNVIAITKELRQKEDFFTEDDVFPDVGRL